MLTLITFLIISSISMRVNSFHSTRVFFKAAFHANPAIETNFEGSNS